MREEFTYPSSDGRTQIHAIIWTPDEGEPRAVLQLIHGMVEFIGRYDRFAAFMARQGYVVVGNDHLGHGASVVGQEDHGWFGLPDGNQYLIEDIHQLRVLTQKRYPALPYFVLGHSMGSFLVQQAVMTHPDGVAGMIVMGTGRQSAGTLVLARTICRVLASRHGWRYRSPFVTKLALGSNNRRFEPARTKNDWLTKDEEIVDAYCANPWDNFMFTLNAYDCMFRGIQFIQKNENIEKIPKELPVCFLSGGEDPVGNFGRAPAKVSEIYKKHGVRDVRLKIYPGDRHELLNETDHQTVDEDVLHFYEEIRQKIR